MVVDFSKILTIQMDFEPETPCIEVKHDHNTLSHVTSSSRGVTRFVVQYKLFDHQAIIMGVLAKHPFMSANELYLGFSGPMGVSCSLHILESFVE